MKNIFFSAFAALLFGVGCAAALEAPADTAEIAPAIAIEVKLNVGQTHTAVLAGNPTTGFTWNIAEQQGDAAEVSLDIRVPEAKDDEPVLCGAPAPTEVTIKGVKPGKSTITVEYKRAWEKDKPALRRVTFDVTVQ